MNARYNGYFNANEEYKKGIKKVKDGHKENYRERLPLFVIGNEEMAKSVQTEMEIAIKKCSRVIQYHSMDIKGKENCKWIDDAWMLIGQAYFYEHNWKECQPVFEYVAKKYKKSDRRYEARVWLVKTLLEQEKFERAEYVLNTLQIKEDKIPEDYVPYYKAVEAEFYLLTNKVEKAIFSLEQAAELEKKKEVQTRYMFVLAQLYAEQGESIRANNTYKAIVKKHPDYEMEFWAQMNRALSYKGEDGSSYDIKKVLLKMLRDDKNKEYRDKLYFALSKIYRQEGSEKKQVRALKLSTRVSVNDNYQKGLSFLTLGQLYFSKPQYKAAQVNYDSAVAYLPEDFPNHKKIVNIQTSLKDLVKQIEIIEREDSLQKLADLPEEELIALIEDVIEEKLIEEEKRREELQGGGSTASGNPTLPGFGDNTTKGKMYFYNTQAVALGKSEFKSVWGGRPNEDNWRRSDRTSISDDDFANASEDVAGADSTINGIKDVNKYLKDIPRDEEAIKASNEKMVDAYYALGNIYKENMSDNEGAIGAFRGLVGRFDTSKHHLTSYYILYRLYYDENNIDSSNYYKRIIMYKYPNSDYAKIIEDPSYAERMDKEKRAVQRMYKKAYYYYTSGYYDACNSKIDETLKKYPKNSLYTKLYYLKALSLGAKGGKKEDVVSNLRAFISGHNGTPEAKDAENRIKLLTEERAAPKPTGEAPKYKYDNYAQHFMVILVPVNGNDIEAIKKSISNYNTAYHVGKSLNFTTILLDKQTQMLTIKNFANLNEGVGYYQDFIGNQTSLKKINSQGFDIFPISAGNYGLFFKDKRVEEYKEFLLGNYQL